MKYMARHTVLWKNDAGRYVKVVAGVTVVESERKLDDDKPPFFYKVSDKAEKATGKKQGFIEKKNPNATVIRRVVEEID